MNAAGSRGLLTLATRQLMARWDETRKSWNDRKAEEFHKEYMDEISAGLGTTLKILEEIDQLLEKIHADCE